MCAPSVVVAKDEIIFRGAVGRWATVKTSSVHIGGRCAVASAAARSSLHGLLPSGALSPGSVTVEAISWALSSRAREISLAVHVQARCGRAQRPRVHVGHRVTIGPPMAEVRAWWAVRNSAATPPCPRRRRRSGRGDGGVAQRACVRVGYSPVPGHHRPSPSGQAAVLRENVRSDMMNPKNVVIIVKTGGSAGVFSPTALTFAGVDIRGEMQFTLHNPPGYMPGSFGGFAWGWNVRSCAAPARCRRGVLPADAFGDHCRHDVLEVRREPLDPHLERIDFHRTGCALTGRRCIREELCMHRAPREP